MSNGISGVNGTTNTAHVGFVGFGPEAVLATQIDNIEALDQSAGKLLDQIREDQDQARSLQRKADDIETRIAAVGENGYVVENYRPSTLDDTAAQYGLTPEQRQALLDGQTVVTQDGISLTYDAANNRLLVNPTTADGIERAQAAQTAWEASGYEVSTAAELKAEAKEIEGKQRELQTALETSNLRLQHLLQQRLQSIQLASNVLKNFHDGNLAVINNLR